MTAKEKAQELGNKFYRGNIFTHGKEAHLQEKKEAKKCALIAVDEIIIVLQVAGVFSFENEIYYWQEVKQEIEKL